MNPHLEDFIMLHVVNFRHKEITGFSNQSKWLRSYTAAKMESDLETISLAHSLVFKHINSHFF